LRVFHPKIAISTENTTPTHVASVAIGRSGESSPKYAPSVVAALAIADGNPVDDGRTDIRLEIRVYAIAKNAVVIMECLCRAF